MKRVGAALPGAAARGPALERDGDDGVGQPGPVRPDEAVPDEVDRGRVGRAGSFGEERFDHGIREVAGGPEPPVEDHQELRAQPAPERVRVDRCPGGDQRAHPGRVMGREHDPDVASPGVADPVDGPSTPTAASTSSAASAQSSIEYRWPLSPLVPWPGPVTMTSRRSRARSGVTRSQLRSSTKRLCHSRAVGRWSPPP